ncbi:alpha-2-macroglobulin-like [Oncorhynchus tshawytscha]|uniref:alpha-2-macroglobulin-like n=1 Tax=Oncorhynchus tshawytscha TaxID=74940 RepID=UPI001C3E3D37|nr:alpha-2-macroglobulin-like [Oncorhynchus tshawytscha]
MVVGLVTTNDQTAYKEEVPSVKTDSVATVHVSIKGRKDEMSKKTKIFIKPKRFLTIFQTDKPVYKPGQTGVILKGSGKASFTDVIVTVCFEDVPQAYKPGIEYEGKIKVTDPDSTPIPNEPVYLFLQNSGTSEDWTLTTDSKGIASFSLDTSLWSSEDTGKVDVEKTVPDTITKWAAVAFCTSSVGFGLAPNTGLTAFQPFVKVILAESDQFTARPCEGCQYTLCLCAEESRTFKWILTPTALGEVSVKVSAEALKTEERCGNEVATIKYFLIGCTSLSHSVCLIYLSPEGPVEKDISLKLPEVFVEGSAKASLSVLGELMGRAMKNLDSLLQMPYGCGEQNMVLFAPNIYILNYLQSTRQLTKEIQARATGFLESGEEAGSGSATRELNYKHDDGSYSAFGKSDESGNTWLTSFVLKSFGGAKPYIFVDPAHIAQAKAWLASHQQNDGSITSAGKLFHYGMKGGVGDQVSLTAYITTALLELDGNTTDPMVEKSLVCLKAAVSDKLDNTYTTALMSYTFALAQTQDMRAKLITHLDKIADTSDYEGIPGPIRNANSVWERAEASGRKTDSLEVEMTSYVLLALLSGPSMPGFGLDYSTAIVRWLAQQQNPYGGFASTQDTVVALQALAMYGAATFSPEGASTVSVSSAGGLNMEFTVNQNNRLLYQEEQLKEVPGDYNIKAQGKSCVFVQIAMHYNIPPPPDFSAFNISTETLGKCNGTKKSMIVSVDVRYNGRREETSMVIINVKLLSGFVLDKSSLRPLKNDPCQTS